MTRRWPAAATVPLVLALAACTSVGTRPATAPASGSGEPDGIGRVASAEAAWDVGTLFRAGSDDHFCSGTIVRGGDADLVVTAAHCVTSGPDRAPSSGLEYAPAYRQGGAAPYGRWKAVRVTVDPRWTEHADPDLDVAFVQLAPRDGRRVTDAVDAQRIGFDTPGSGPVRLTGYPDGADDPLTCLGTMSRRADGQLQVACTGYAPAPAARPGSPASTRPPAPGRWSA